MQNNKTEYIRQWRADHPAYAAAWRKANHDKVKAASRKYRQGNATKANCRKQPCADCGAIFGNNHKRACRYAHQLPPDTRYKKQTPEQLKAKRAEYHKKWRLQARETAKEL